MTYTMNIPVEHKKIVADACHLVMNTEYPSGVDIGYICSLANYEADAQFHLLYEMLVAAHARALLQKADPGDIIYSAVKKAHWLGDQSYAEVEFSSETDAMLFKLANGGEA